MLERTARVRMPAEMYEALAQIAEEDMATVSTVVRWAIRDYLRTRGEGAMLRIAQAIHGEVCGCDDKRCATYQEIYDWLEGGDLDGTETVASLIAEWQEEER